MNREAASIIMAIMYAARMARFDLLRAVGHLARKLTKWTDLEDKKLRRIVEYIHSTYDVRLTGFIRDDSSELSLVQYSDADFASDRGDAKSTSGLFLALVGPTTFFPLAAHSRKQAAVSHSTAEAEVVAAEDSMRELGVPALDLWETILEREVKVQLLEDNQTTAINIRTGRFPKLRHVQRMHGVNIRWLYDGIQRGIFSVQDCHTQRMAADIFTKHFTSKDSWDHAVRMLGFRSENFTRTMVLCPSVPSGLSPLPPLPNVCRSPPPRNVLEVFAFCHVPNLTSDAFP